jgi:predicted Zn-dependent peptidase
VASWLGTQELLLGKVATVDHVIGHIDSVSTEGVAQVAQKMLNENKLRLAVVGPHRSDKPLRKLLHF